MDFLLSAVVFEFMWKFQCTIPFLQDGFDHQIIIYHRAYKKSNHEDCPSLLIFLCHLFNIAIVKAEMLRTMGNQCPIHFRSPVTENTPFSSCLCDVVQIKLRCNHSPISAIHLAASGNHWSQQIPLKFLLYPMYIPSALPLLLLFSYSDSLVYRLNLFWIADTK